MTHIENIPHILQHGITHRTSPNCNPEFVPIGDSRLIGARDDLTLNNGRKLGDYIPFYFGTRMPMLYVIQRGHNGVPITPAEKIVYCISSVQKIMELGLTSFLPMVTRGINLASNIRQMILKGLMK